MRWSESNSQFEVCQAKKWVPVKFCDRNCGFLPPPFPSMPAKESQLSCPTSGSEWDGAVWYNSQASVFSFDQYHINISNLNASSRGSTFNASAFQKSCASLNFSASAFLHLKAFYNVSDWYNESLPSQSNVVNDTGASKNCYSKVLALASGKGLISDGPGAFGIYEQVNFLGTAVPLAVLIYTPPSRPGSSAAGASPSPPGILDISIYVSSTDPSVADWKVGSKLNISLNLPKDSPDPKSALNGITVTLISWDNGNGKATAQLPSNTPYISCNPCAEIATASLIIPGICLSDGGGCYYGVYAGTACAWYIQPPPGSIVRLNITSIDFLPGDTIYVDTSTAVNNSILEAGTIDVKSAPLYVTPGAKLTNKTSVFISEYGRPMLVIFCSNGSHSAGGFNASYEILARVGLMKDMGNATNLQYALAILEMQGVNLTNVVSLSGETFYESLFSRGNGVLGPVSNAERCFMCYWDNLTKNGQSPSSAQATLPVFAVRPPRNAVGLDQTYNFAVPTEITASEIPPAVSAMGYNVAHFVRTGYVSRFPPGSFKAPATGQRLGPIPSWNAAAGTDPSIPQSQQPIRADIGWGLETAVVGNAMDWFTASPWGWGWDDGYSPQGTGKQWRDGDGANDAIWPEWQVLKPKNRIADPKRLDYDLDHATVPLFSFVDSSRRIVYANELALSAPCGVSVNNTCDLRCGNIVGTGLNLQQCMAKAATTNCNAPVVDACNNDCGILGTKDCWEYATAFSMLRIHSIGSASTGSFGMTVGKADRDDAMYLSYQDSRIAGVSIDTLNQLKEPLFFNFSTGLPCNLDCLKNFFFLPSNQVVMDLILSRYFNSTSLTPYPQIGIRPWPSLSDLARKTCTSFNTADNLRYTLWFCMFDWDRSRDLNGDEFLALIADLEARREALKNELWARMERSKQNLMKIKSFKGIAPSPGRIYGYGVDFASPDCVDIQCYQYNKSNTLRISTNSQFEGDFIQVGMKQNVNVPVCTENSTCTNNTPSSHVFIDGVIENSCPLVMRSNASGHLTSLCLEKPKSMGMLALPDANGIVVTSGNLEAVHALVGLRGNRWTK
jgi:hypothetical protein